MLTRVISLAFVALLAADVARAADTAYIPVGQAHAKKTVIAFPEIRASGSGADSLARQVHETVVNDLTFMDLFSFMGQSAFVEPSSAGITMGSFRFSDWS